MKDFRPEATGYLFTGTPCQEDLSNHTQLSVKKEVEILLLSPQAHFWIRKTGIYLKKGHPFEQRMARTKTHGMDTFLFIFISNVGESTAMSYTPGLTRPTVSAALVPLAVGAHTTVPVK